MLFDCTLLRSIGVLFLDAFEHTLLHGLLLILTYALLRCAQSRLPRGECLHRLLLCRLHRGSLPSRRRALQGLAIACLCRGEPIEEVSLTVTAPSRMRFDALRSLSRVGGLAA